MSKYSKPGTREPRTNKEGTHMTNKDNLPIWARILLGVPVTGAASDDRQSDNVVADRQQSVGAPEHHDREQSVLLFDTAGGKRKQKWQDPLCLMPGKLRS